MPCLIKAVVELQRTSGISADTVNNDWYFLDADNNEVTAGDADDLRTAIVAWFNTIHAPGTTDIASSISTTISRAANAHTINFYSVESPPTYPFQWGSPKQVRSFTLDAALGGSNNIPGEVALVMTYHGDLTDIPETETNPTPPPATIRPASRRRGRIFWGPFNTQVLSQQAPDNEPFPNVLISNAIIGAGTGFQAALPVGIDWVVHSEAAQEAFVVTGGWVDNAFDSQRRRGNSPDARTTFVA